MPTINRADSVQKPQPVKADADALFKDAIASKRAGDVGRAIELLDDALKLEPKSASLQIARAGYQLIQGDVDGARASFDAVQVPPPVDGPVNVEGFNYHLNATWFHGLAGDDAACVESAKQVLRQAPEEPARKALAEYFDSEPDLQRLKSHPGMLAVLGRGPTQTFDTEPAPDASRAADFVAGQGKPSAGQSPLNARLQAATKPKPEAPGVPAREVFDAMRTNLRGPDQALTARIGQLIETSIREALLSGDRSANLKTGALDGLLDGSGAYSALAERLEAAGYSASADGFTGVSIRMDDAAVEDKAAALAKLTSSVSPPGAHEPGALLGTLIQGSIDRAVAAGDDRAQLKTGELDKILRPLKIKYSALADELRDLGFTAFADGFTGVSLGWEAKPDPGLDKAALAKLEVPPPSDFDAGSLLASLVDQKVAEAVASGETFAHLDNRELSGLMKKIGARVGDIGEALKQAGFRTSADGFVGVGLSW